jgi:hypothetical protein
MAQQSQAQGRTSGLLLFWAAVRLPDLPAESPGSGRAIDKVGRSRSPSYGLGGI